MLLNPAHNSSLAKLLATENLTVIHGSFRTASFEPEKRVLRLPIFKDMGKNAYDLMVGHEVGHALFTPAEGWRHGIKVEGLPASLINIIEDVRIERLVQKRYPGLVRSFKLGYTKLFEANFFGTQDRDLETYKFLDRLNIKAKMRDQVEISFSPEEQVFVDKAERCETFEDVLALAHELKKYLEENKEEDTPETDQEDFEMEFSDEEISEEQSQPAPGENGDDEDQESESSSDESDDEGESEQGEEGDDEDENGDNEGDAEGSENEAGEEGSTEDERENDKGSAHDGAGLDEVDPFESETDKAFREKEEDLVDKGDEEKTIHHLASPTLRQWKERIISDKAILEMIRESDSLNFLDHDNNYKNFLTGGARKAVNHMVKEFEMRRSADRHARAKTSRKGTLDTKKIHTYKYNDEIFNQVTTLADGKNHGLMVLVDFSGSMVDIFDGTIKNAIQLAMFCRQVNIPFQIYGFTSICPGEKIDEGYDQVDPTQVTLYDIFNHKQSKSAFTTIADHLIRLTKFEEDYRGKPDPQFLSGYTGVDTIRLGGTPLDATVLALHELIPAFQKETRVQIMNTFFLTDGDSHSIHILKTMTLSHSNRPDFFKSRYNEYAVVTKKGLIQIPTNRMYAYAATRNFYASLAKNTGSRLFGFHMTARAGEAQSYVRNLTRIWDGTYTEEIKFGYRKLGYAKLDNVAGLTSLILMKPVSGEDDEFEVEDDISKQQLKKQFGKFMKAKKTNRLIFAEFGKLVA